MTETNTVLTLLMCFICSIGFAKSDEISNDLNNNYKYSKKRTIDANYDIDNDYALKLTGKYSDYNIVNWDENRISIHVEIIVKSNKESVLDDVLSRIDVTFSDIKKSKETKKVEATTQIDNLQLNNTSISIDYYIMIPNGMNIIVDNIYGDVVIQSAKDINIKLKYGDADIDEADYINAEIMYSDIAIKNVNKLKAEVRYSELDCSYAKTANIEVMYTDTYFKKIDDMKVNNLYGDIEIDNLTNKIDCTLKYSDLEIENINKDFTQINIDTMYSDVAIVLTQEHYFNYNISSSYGDILCKMLKDNANKYIKLYHKETIIGNINDNDKLHNINIEAMYGDIEIDFE